MKNRDSFQYLENLASGYWNSQVLFTAIEIGLFSGISEKGLETEELAISTGCRPKYLSRFLTALEDLKLVRNENGKWKLTAVSSEYLLPDRPGYLGDFLLYRRYLQQNWMGLTEKILIEGNKILRLTPGDAYAVRNFHYVRAMDQLASRKAVEIADVIGQVQWKSPIIDIGGGAGAISREILERNPGSTGILIEIPEVIEMAKRLYPHKESWYQLTPVAADFRLNLPFRDSYRFGVIIMSNFLHTYDEQTAGELIKKAAELTHSETLFVIHDYFPDLKSEQNPRGSLHDLNMLMNTQNGQCHFADNICQWFSEISFGKSEKIRLSSDSCLILARFSHESTASTKK